MGQHVKAALTGDRWFRADQDGDIEAVTDVDSMKVRWSYAEHREGVAFQFECLADRTGLSAKFALPKLVADDGAGRAGSRRGNTLRVPAA